MWTRSLVESKIRAWLVHLSISGVIFLPILYLLWVRWFPPPMFFTDGGIQGLKIMIPVDLMIGPTLTFLLFDRRKSRRELTLDFSIIAAIQLAALAYGYLAVEKRSIQALTFQDDHFTAVSTDLLRRQGHQGDSWPGFGDGPVHWAYTRQPDGGDEMARAMQMMMEKAVPIDANVEFMEPLARHWDEVRGKALDMEAELKAHPALADGERRLREAHPGQTLYFFRLAGEDRGALLALDGNAHPVGALYPEGRF